MNDECKIGFFGVVGRTNVGKSTLVNALVGQKVSIVTHKVQTTKSKVLGIFTEGDSQVVLIDTPGLFRSKGIEGAKMVGESWNEIHGTNNLLLIVDISKNVKDQLSVLNNTENMHVTLVFNKIDRVNKTIIPPIIKQITNEHSNVESVFLISAINDDGVDDLRRHLLSKCVSGDWAFESGTVTNLPFNKFAAEITREKVYELVNKEVPYKCEVETVKVDGNNIYQTIYVRKESHKPIVIGKNGSKIRSIGTSSRIELSILFRKKFNLFLNVELLIKQ